MAADDAFKAVHGDDAPVEEAESRVRKADFVCDGCGGGVSEVDFGAEGVEADGAKGGGGGVLCYGDVGFFGEAVGGVVDVVDGDGVVDGGGEGGEGGGLA